MRKYFNKSNKLLGVIAIIVMVSIMCSVAVYAAAEEAEPCNHTYEETYRKNPTCAGHGYVTYTCTKCQDEYSETIYQTGNEEHYLIESDSCDATCTEDGRVESWCYYCDEKFVEVIPAIGGHNYEESYHRNPTCAGHGSATYTCKLCGDEYHETIHQTGNEEHYWIESDSCDATCTQDGYIESWCYYCDEKLIEVIPATGERID